MPIATAAAQGSLVFFHGTFTGVGGLLKTGIPGLVVWALGAYFALEAFLLAWAALLLLGAVAMGGLGCCRRWRKRPARPASFAKGVQRPLHLSWSSAALSQEAVLPHNTAGTPLERRTSASTPGRTLPVLVQ